MPGIYPWSPNQVAPGYKVFPEGLIVGGVLQIQKGTYSFPPPVTAPGTVASGGTVQNNTGTDCQVYASATTGIQSVKVLSFNGATTTSLTPAGTVPGAATAAYYVPGPGAIAVTYTGTLSWTWQGI